MSSDRNEQFYSRLPANHISLGELLTEEHLFYEVPASWHVVITDIRNSTNAVASGLHETVNLIATGSIVSVLNIAFKAGITMPFFFGGDGATFILPPSIVDPAMRALAVFRRNTRESFGLDLRIGTIPVSEIYANDFDLKLSKLRVSGTFSIPVVLGEGLYYAEKIIKSERYYFNYEPAADDELDLTGMQCRWDRIGPPENDQEVVTLLVCVPAGRKQAAYFAKVMEQIDGIYGPYTRRQPISVPRLIWKTTFKKMEMEMVVRKGYANMLGMVASWIAWLTGYVYFRTSQGRNYLNSLVEMSDTLVIDGKINTVITGTPGQRAELQKALDEMEEAREIHYGLHVSNESVMSCYVHDLKDGHIHFVDGAEGGYTKAAGMLKRKLRDSLGQG
ncbi:hypothetical protein GCM10010967_22770 [Dyadobacter beijingensis]|uniref:DUF3095 domain-containing protein n=2 Tax=Dyadobacter beijingensis TaxID=365489 RepID=A0ABQ2HTL2_9BACT|nr:DUF3095 domain-containing protein [Dyadobacter beijingensis]GGM89425.1 hypothetical protein GCM10010967_22770 [Dyadobacter beijingensis]